MRERKRTRADSSFRLKFENGGGKPPLPVKQPGTRKPDSPTSGPAFFCPFSSAPVKVFIQTAREDPKLAALALPSPPPSRPRKKANAEPQPGPSSSPSVPWIFLTTSPSIHFTRSYPIQSRSNASARKKTCLSPHEIEAHVLSLFLLFLPSRTHSRPIPTRKPSSGDTQLRMEHDDIEDQPKKKSCCYKGRKTRTVHRSSVTSFRSSPSPPLVQSLLVLALAQ